MSRIALENVRLSFPNVFKRATFGGEETKFEATFLIDKEDTATIAKINAAIQAKLIEKYGSEDKIPKGIKSDSKCCFRDGDNVSYDGYAGHMSFKAANKVRPTVVDRDKNPTTEDDGLIYAGCYVDAVVDVWIQDNQWGKKVNGNLYVVRYRGEGAPFGAGAVPEGALDDLADLESTEGSAAEEDMSDI